VVARTRDQLREGVRFLARPLVLLLDGLDRLNDAFAFAQFILWDVQALAELGVGVVVVGPQALTLEANQRVRGRFGTEHLVAAPAISSTSGLEFLRAVLLRRAGADILTESGAEVLARSSGGLLRDLINLARAAGELAYGAGAAAVGAEHAQAAAAAYGRQMLLGITKPQATRMHDFWEFQVVERKRVPVAKPLHFTLATDLDLSLLLGRLIIEVDDVPVRYIPHPTIVPLIPGLPR
jgi:Cdc6-like AAA superfamily ATPase